MSSERNTATGVEALHSITTGRHNTANGDGALRDSETGEHNTAVGESALKVNREGSFNTATGAGALYLGPTGSNNTATGYFALRDNQANNNTATGFHALANNQTGNNNIAVGYQAGINLTGSNNIDIGAFGVSGDSNTIRIGRQGLQNSTFIQGIFGNPMSGDVVVVNSSGKLGVTTSSARFKDNIKPMDKTSEVILALEPVTFRYKEEIDPEGIPQFGLIAEQVEKVNPNLVARDADGKPYTVRYDAVNAMLLNEFLKEHRTVQELKSTVAKQEAIIAKQQKAFEATATHQQKQIETLTAGLQKVSAQIELSKPTPQVVANNH
jgi:hypothetical protein